MVDFYIYFWIFISVFVCLFLDITEAVVVFEFYLVVSGDGADKDKESCKPHGKTNTKFEAWHCVYILCCKTFDGA